MPDHCIVDGCGCVHKSRWLCGRHYDVLRASPVEVRMDWPTLRDGEPTAWDIERLLASESATLAQDSATDSATDSARVAELEAELGVVTGENLQMRAERSAHKALRRKAEAERDEARRERDIQAETARKMAANVAEATEERVTELLAERADAVHELAEVEALLRAIYADVVSVEQCERLVGARAVALGLRRVLTSRSEASCQRDGMMHVPRVHLETVASVLSKAADELEPWRTDRDGVVGLMVRASADHLELLLEGE